MQSAGCISLPWHDPVPVLADGADEPYALGFISDGSAKGRWSYVLRRPVTTFTTMADALDALSARPARSAAWHDDLPPFRGGLAGLASYEWSGALEAACPQERTAAWPDLAIGLYDRLLAFDHHEKRVWAIGQDVASAEGVAAWLGKPHWPARSVRATFEARRRAQPYPDDVACVVEAICAGEIFQANIARTWVGSLEAGTPFDVMRRLADASPAPFAGYLRLPGLALVSNSPERFVRVTSSGHAETRPIKGTRPRGRGAEEDRALAAELLASAKDRAENLMIVDLMRNDLSRVCRIGSVKVDAFCALESFANVHHLVSTVSGRLLPGAKALDLFASAFPPGSVTGAPKIQAMQVIARHEAPRGPYCGSLFWFGFDGAFDSSVLIRTLAFEENDAGWRFEARAGAGITADSDPFAEDAEAVAKIAAIRGALTGSC
jgi:para-aminobenzoate synthetase component 1